MYFSRAARFQTKTKIEVLSAPSQRSAIPSFNFKPKKTIKTADEKSFDDFMNIIQNSFRAIRQANKAKEECLRETEKESQKAYRTKQGSEKERLTLRGGMFVRLVGKATWTELAPGTYKQHNETLEKRGYNIMEVKKDIEKKRNRSKH